MSHPDLIRFEPKPTFTRREFVMTTLATGFAAAVQPVAASTQITTDAGGLTAGEVKIPTKDGAMAAYRSNRTPARTSWAATSSGCSRTRRRRGS